MYYARSFIHETKVVYINVQMFTSYAKVVMKEYKHLLTREIILCILDHLYLSEIVIFSMALHLPLPKMYLGMTQELTALGNLPLLKYFSGFGSYCVWFSYLSAKYNQLDILNWYKDTLGEKDLSKLMPQAIEGAIEADHVEAISWCLPYISQVYPLPNIYNARKEVIRKCCVSGSLEILKFLDGKKQARILLPVVARNGHLHILKWIYEPGISMKNGMVPAAIENQLRVVEWIHSVGEVFSINDDISGIDLAKITKHEKVYEFLRKNGYF